MSVNSRQISIIIPAYSDLEQFEKLLVSLDKTLTFSEIINEILIINDNPNSKKLAELIANWREQSKLAVTVKWRVNG